MWETILVCAAIGGAGFYLGRRIVRTWQGKGGEHGGCAGCGHGKTGAPVRKGRG